MECLFCKIVQGEIPAKKLFEDEDTLAFFDINPAAPSHVLVIPKAHYDSILECDNANMLGKLVASAKRAAQELNICETGYRIVINTGENGGQTIGHLHLHVLGGRQLGWPPG